MLRSWNAQALLAGGGFVSAPAAYAARWCSIPVVATEADAHLGLANRLSARVSQRLCSAYPLPQVRRRQVVTGRPVASSFWCADRSRAREQLGIASDDRVVVIFGGSGGARQVNQAVWDAWSQDAALTIDGHPLHVFHVTGRRDFPEFAQRQPASVRYQCIEYSNDMPQLLAAADLAVCRSGGSVFELAACALPAVLIPFPHATANHQMLNAQHFVTAGAAELLHDEQCSGSMVRERVESLLSESSSSLLRSMADAMRSCARPNAADDIAGIVSDLAFEHARLNGTAPVEVPTSLRADTRPLAGRRFHMLGAGGAGVSALAQIASAWGAEVTGCDQSQSTYVDIVRSHGIDVSIGHDPSHVEPGMEVVVSSAVRIEHPEVAAAQDHGCRVWLRGELLGELTRMRRTVVVAGAHGKSTTSAMISHVLHALGIDATIVVGATMGGLGNAYAGSSEWMVVEGDESDRTLLALAADIAIITNIERDHHHTFPTDDDVYDVYAAWVASLADDTVLIAGAGAMVDRIVEVEAGRLRIVRIGDMNDDIEALRGELRVPGEHNLLNAAAALAACKEIGCEADAARRSVVSFAGIGRRFEVHGSSPAGALVVDDYAHHPSEVRATIQAARAYDAHRRVCVVFQPHLFSRTRELWREFADALSEADRVWVLEIYGAREAPEPGVTSALIANEINQLAPGVLAAVLDIDPATGDIATIADELTVGDTVITMGAGSITQLAPRLAGEQVRADGNRGSA